MLTVAKVDKFDIVNNPKDTGVAMTVWFSGCDKKCPGCHNTKLWDRNSGKEMEYTDIVDMVDTSVHKSVVLLGGEPMDQPIVDILLLITSLSEIGLKIWLYTYHEIDILPDTILDKLYAIKTGMYIEELHNDGLLASSNQKMFIRNTDNKLEEVTL